MSNQKPAITSISIENFKGIGSRVAIPLKPLMLFYGPNSAGKSTIVEALLLANEVFNGRNPNVDKVDLGGDLVRLGGFKSYVHNKDLGNTVKIRIEAQLGGISLPTYESKYGITLDEYFAYRGFDVPFDSNSHFDLIESIKKYSLENLVDVKSYFIECSLELHGRWLCVGYKAGVNNDWLLQTESNSAFSILPSEDRNRRYLPKTFQHTEFKFNTDHDALKSLASQSENMKRVLNILDKEIESPNCACKFDRINSIDKTFENPLIFESIIPAIPEEEYLEVFGYEDAEIMEEDLAVLGHISSQLMVGGRKNIGKCLGLHIFLGPFRSVPPRELNSLKLHDLNWSDGSAAWARIGLPKPSEEKIRKIQQKVEADIKRAGREADITEFDVSDEFYHEHAIDEWGLSKPEDDDFAGCIDEINYLLKTIGIDDITLQAKIYYSLDSNTASLSVLKKALDLDRKQIGISSDRKESIKNELEAAEKRIELQIIDSKKHESLHMADVGTGISQVVPVLVSLLSKAVLKSIEQPELHLHPKLQCGLGDAFIYAVNQDKSDADQQKARFATQTLVETHSEHLLLRILRRLKESSKNTDPSGLSACVDDIAVFAVEETGNESFIYEMEISEEGELLTPWPNGFFPERMQEILGN